MMASVRRVPSIVRMSPGSSSNNAVALVALARESPAQSLVTRGEHSIRVTHEQVIEA